MKPVFIEMTESEMESTSGGNWLMYFVTVATAVAGYLANGVITNWEEFKKGVADGYGAIAQIDL